MPAFPTTICTVILNAAAGFSGVRYKVPTQEERESVEQARVIRDAGLRQLGEEDEKS